MARRMKDSGIEWIGMIPEEWSVSKVKYFVDCYDGQRVPVDSAERVSGPYPYWGAGSITDYVDKYLFDEELVLLGEDGAPFFDYTRPVAFLVNEKIWVNNHIHVLKPHENIDSSYLTHFLNIVDYKSYINGSILNKLTQSNMNTIAFVCPRKEEEQKIATYLDAKVAKIDEAISKTRSTIEEYKALKQSVITKAVTKGIRGDRPMKDSGIEWIGEIPEEWILAELKNFIRVNNGKEIQVEIDSYEENAVPVYGSGGVFKYTDSSLYEGEAVMFGRKGTLGKPLYVNEKFWTVDTMYFLSDFNKINAKYNYYQLCAFDWEPFITHTALPSIVASQIVACKFPVPTVDEQEEIVQYLDSKCSAIDAIITKKEQLIIELESYKKSLIYEYVTGKKEVPEYGN